MMKTVRVQKAHIFSRSKGVTRIWGFVSLILCLVSRCVLVHAMCQSNKMIKIIKVLDQPKTVVSSNVSVDGEAEEWVFEADEPHKFLTVTFSAFDLAGPDCGRDVPAYSTVNVETQLNGITLPHYRFCKGRRSPVSVSSMGRLLVAYCHKYIAGKIEFVVSPESNARLLVEEAMKSVSVHKKRNISWIYLNSLNGGIAIDFSNVSTKKTATDACKKAFISVRNADSKYTDQSLLPNGEEKVCNVKDKGALKAQFPVRTSLQGVNITYKNAAFTLSFWEFVEEEQATGINHEPTVTGHILEIDSATNSTMNTGQGDETSGSMARIIALGCGGILVLIVIIGTLIYFKRRAKKGRSSAGKSKSRKSLRGTLTTAAGDGEIVRVSNAGSIDNAMYDRILGGHNTLERSASTDGEEKNESRRERLAELEEKYGPFPETSTSASASLIIEESKLNSSFKEDVRRNEYSTQHKFPESDHSGLFRKGTRPLLPPPSGILATRTTKVTVSDNLYETIDHPHVKTTPWLKNATRQSCLTLTSDEFSDDDLSIYKGVSYDPVPQDNNYAIIFNEPPVPYDPVDEGELVLVPCVEYGDTSTGSSLGGSRVPEVKYHANVAGCSRNTPKIDIHPPTVMTSPLKTAKSTPILNDADSDMLKDGGNQREFPLNPNLLHGKSHDAINSKNSGKSVQHYLAPRPSLPEITTEDGYLVLNSDRSCSIASSLQEDAESYLRPRPSFPDAMIDCAYSSSEDISQLRKRLLAAAHPSLLDDTTSKKSTAVPPSKSWYDSPRPSLGDIGLAPPSVSQYASPRRRDRPNPV